MKKKICVLILACATLLSACGNAVTKEILDNYTNSVSIKKDGYIESMITEEFSEDYYDVGELETMINQTISEYQKDSPNSEISVKKCMKFGSNVIVEMKYNDYKAYAGFNGEQFFSGTIKEAYELGYDLDYNLNAVSADTKNKTTISKQELLNMGGNHIVIMEINNSDEESQNAEPVYINCFGEVLYVGEGVSLSGKKTAMAEISNGTAVVVFK